MLLLLPLFYWWGFPSGSVVKNPPANAGDAGSIPGSGRSPGEENGHPLQYSCLGNPMNRGGLAGYSPWGLKRIGHDSVTKQKQCFTDKLTEAQSGHTAGKWKPQG